VRVVFEEPWVAGLIDGELDGELEVVTVEEWIMLARVVNYPVCCESACV